MRPSEKNKPFRDAGPFVFFLIMILFFSVESHAGLDRSESTGLQPVEETTSATETKSPSRQPVQPQPLPQQSSPAVEPRTNNFPAGPSVQPQSAISSPRTIEPLAAPDAGKLPDRTSPQPQPAPSSPRTIAPLAAPDAGKLPGRTSLQLQPAILPQGRTDSRAQPEINIGVDPRHTNRKATDYYKSFRSQQKSMLLPPGRVGSSYFYRLAFFRTGGVASYMLNRGGIMPDGLRLLTNGTVTGVPVKAGVFTFSVQAKAGSDGSDMVCQLNIADRPGERSINNKNQDKDGLSKQYYIKNTSKDAPQADLNAEVAENIEENPLTDELNVETAGEEPAYVKGQIVIVVEESKRGQHALEAIVKKYELSVLDDFSIRSLKQRAVVCSTKTEVFSLINDIKKENGIIGVQQNNIFSTMSEPDADLQSISKTLNFSLLHQHFRGKGILVAIIDTGVDLDHPDLRERIKASKNFLPTSLYKGEIHGTAVAGIICAGINGKGIEGIAPESKILALRACKQMSATHPSGSGSTVSVIKAIDYALAKRAKIINMSFGSRLPDMLIDAQLKEGVGRGVIFVAPVGNVSGITGPAFPASSFNVVSVGGMDNTGNPFPDEQLAAMAQVLAPCEDIFTTIPQNGYNFLSGTSVSSAVVAGIIATAASKNKFLEKRDLPDFKGDICRWTEELLHTKLCITPAPDKH